MSYPELVVASVVTLAVVAGGWPLPDQLIEALLPHDLAGAASSLILLEG